MQGYARKRRPFLEEGSYMSVTWRVRAVVGDDSAKFAADLEKALNDGSEEGFELAQMMHRSTDNGVVLIHQKYKVEAPGEPVPLPRKGDN